MLAIGGAWLKFAVMSPLDNFAVFRQSVEIASGTASARISAWPRFFPILRISE